ncbi:MAG: hypothetical protein AAGE93_07850 [Bacteroidota bacterium]
MSLIRSPWMRVLLVAMALGTAWAVRGQFGHEHGAAWAGAIGVLSVLVLANRSDWWRRLPTIASLGAIGWGAGGMMSYGMVVGYGRGDDWFNVSYGLCMLFLIGGLYGYIGGGLTGLALESTKKKKPDWAILITQMVAGGYLIWGILIYQLEWLMTPPRSELWAACLGAALALGWYLNCNGFQRSITAALYSSLGAGFGFAFGNFLQVLGSASGLMFNWWNVMEYSIGFFGGLGMAYSIFSQNWSESRLPDKISNQLGWIFLIILLPLTNLIQQFNTEKFTVLAERIDIVNGESITQLTLNIAWGGSLLISILLMIFFWRKVSGISDWKLNNTWWLLMIYLGLFIFLSGFLTGAHWGYGSLRDILYWLNTLFILLLGRVVLSPTANSRLPQSKSAQAIQLGVVSVLLLLALSWILVQSHGELPGEQIRFSLWK